MVGTKCRTCGDIHPVGPCPQHGASRSVRRRLAVQAKDVSQKAAPVSHPEPPVSQKPLDVDHTPVVVSHDGASVSQSTTYRYRDAEKRRAYMRDWMRRKRADE